MSRYLFLYLLVLLIPRSGMGQNSQAQQKFKQIQAMVNSNQFEMNFTIATTHYNYYLQPTTPYMDQNIRIDSDSAFIQINDTLATGYLPYFSSGYSFPQTGIKGIIFDNKILNQAVRIRGKGRKQVIIYQFEVIGKNDSYKINLDIQYNGICYLYVNSTRRSPISYSGAIK